MKKLKIVLIDANTGWMKKNSHVPGQVVLPIGLMYLASFLKKKFGNRQETKIINTAIDIDDVGDLLSQLNLFNPDIIGLRVLSTNKAFFEEILKKIKRNHKNALIVVGGPHVTCQPEDVLRLKEVDLIVIGEGELTFAELIERVLKNSDYRDIDGIGYLRGNKVIINPPRRLIENLDLLPFPDYSYINLKRYGRVLNYGYTVRKQGVILTSRGCPFFCAYCFKTLGRPYRKRSPQNVFSEISFLVKKYQIRDFFVVDDNFNIDRQRAVDFLKLIIKNKLKIRLYFASGLRGDLLDKEIIDLMFKAGTIWITFAVETVNKRLQQLVNRVYNVEKMRKNIIYAASKNIMTGLFFMIGFPTETKEEAMETINFVKELDCVTMPFIFGVRYFPNTPLTNYALKNNFINQGVIKNIYSYYHDLNSLETSTMTNSDFREIFYLFLKDIFLNKKRLNRAFKLQEKYLSDKEIRMLYSSFFSKKIENPRLFLKKYLKNI